MRETEGGSNETGSNKVTGIVWAQDKSCGMMWNDIMDGREATQRGKWKGDSKLAV